MVALAACLAALAALVTGFLSWADGASPAGATLAGGYAFGGVLLLVLTVGRVLRRGL